MGSTFQWRTQEFCSGGGGGGGGGKFVGGGGEEEGGESRGEASRLGWGERTERMGIWGQ